MLYKLICSPSRSAATPPMTVQAVTHPLLIEFGVWASMALAARRRREWLEDERLQTKIGTAPAQRPASAGVRSSVVTQRRQQAQVALKVGGVLPGGAAPHQHAPPLAQSADGHKQHEQHGRMSKLENQRSCSASSESQLHWYSKA